MLARARLVAPGALGALRRPARTPLHLTASTFGLKGFETTSRVRAQATPPSPTLERTESPRGASPFASGSKHPFAEGGGGGAGRGRHDGPADPIAGPSGRRQQKAEEEAKAAEPAASGKDPARAPELATAVDGKASESATADATRDETTDAGRKMDGTAVPDPKPADVAFALPARRHPFDTYAFVSQLEAASVSSKAARTLLEGVRGLIRHRGGAAYASLLTREEADNDAYRFRAALTEVRTESSARAMRDGVALRTTAAQIRREVDGLDLVMREDINALRHDIDMDMNNRKNETRAGMKRHEISVEELNNKFTISLSDLRTEIESAKWDATRRAITIIAVLVVTGVALSTFAFRPAVPETAPAPAAPESVMVDAAMGPDQHDEEHEADHHRHTVATLDKLLQERDWRKYKEREQGTESVGVGGGRI